MKLNQSTISLSDSLSEYMWGPPQLQPHPHPHPQSKSQSQPRSHPESQRHPSTITKDASPGLPKSLVIYFPQYHSDPVNDKHWGANFTDWDSLRKAPAMNKLKQQIPRPLTKADAAMTKADAGLGLGLGFRGINISSNINSNTNSNSDSDSDLPPPLGYYDLADQEPRKTQGILAKKYGIDGFIYHHYWFYDESHPGPTLARPLENMLEDGHPDLPFLLNWCAVRWVNVWMGKAIHQTIPTSKNRAITLQEQYFNATQDMIHDHYRWLKPFFDHPNYIRVDGQPVFLLYSWDPRALPVLESLRRFAVEDGFPGLHLIVGRSSHPEELYDTSNLAKQFEYNFNQRQTRNAVDPTQTNSSARSIYWPEPEPEPPSNATSSTPKAIPVERAWDYNPFNQTMTYPYPLAYMIKPLEVPGWCTKPPPVAGDASSLSNDTNTDSDTQSKRTPVADVTTSNSNTNSNHQRPNHPEIIGVITTFDNTPRRKFDFASIWNADSPDEALERFSKSYQAALYYQKCCVDVLGYDASTSSTRSAAAPDSSSFPASPRLDGAVGTNRNQNHNSASSNSNSNRFVVINAWNEWGEAMTIEPSDVYGYRWLETIQAVQKKVEQQSCSRWE